MRNLPNLLICPGPCRAEPPHPYRVGVRQGFVPDCRTLPFHQVRQFGKPSRHLEIALGQVTP